MVRLISTTMKDDQLRKEFGARLSQLRRQHKCSQKELAQKLGVSFQY
ncbi:MAG: helix-turn-helix transcriptional regulator [Candidatus Riflebacteria bacterium]|nr:helix-turn-helix transcriptional regulator [Candidatus Riflebacteria bacterium]